MAVASWKENNDAVHKLYKAQTSIEAGRGNASAVQGYESAQNPPPNSVKTQSYSASPPTPAELHQWQLSSKAKRFKPVGLWGLIVHSKTS